MRVALIQVTGVTSGMNQVTAVTSGMNPKGATILEPHPSKKQRVGECKAGLRQLRVM